MEAKLEKAKTTLDEKGHAIDDFVEGKAAKHGFTKFQVWLGLGIGALAIVGAARLFGWI